MRTLSVVLVLVLACSLCAAQTVLDYGYFVSRLTDLDSLPLLEAGTSCKQWSSWDRRSLDPKYWDANGDAGKYETYDPVRHGPVPLKPGEALMGQMEGPGCIFRIWSANPVGKIRFYLDGATEPTYEFDFNGLFSGDYEDFKPPFVYKRSSQRTASDCYLPIPYAKSCRVTADAPHGQYYHVGYMTYPRGTQVESFRWPLDAKAKAACAEVAAKWNACGQDPRPATSDDGTVTQKLHLEPWKLVRPVQLTGPAVIKTLRARIESPERYAWRKVLLKVWFDDEAQPAILCPLGEFFGTGWQPNEYASYPLGVIQGEGYSFWAMPFRKVARIELLNRGTIPAEVTLSVKWTQTPVPDSAALFHAKWRRENPAREFDYPFIETAGQGRLVGVALYIDHPVPGWWGEGDEKVWVDGEAFPSIFGTGSEDFFGDAWGIRKLIQPSFACNYDQGQRTCCYRWFLGDHIPYGKSLRMTIENYPPPDDYVTVAYWYQKAGGKDFFAADAAEDMRPWGRSLPNTIEAEDLWAEDLGQSAQLLADDGRQYEFSRGLAVDFGLHKAGYETPTAVFSTSREGVVYPTFYPVPSSRETPTALLGASIDGVKLEPLGLTAEGTMKFAGILLEAGSHKLSLVALDEGHLAVDCLRLEPPSKTKGALEVEQLLSTARTSGGKVSVESGRLAWSDGRQLLLDAQGAGSEVSVSFANAAPAEVSMIAQVTTGPDYGQVQFLVNGVPAGGVTSCYSEEAGLRKVGLGTVRLGAGNQTLTARVVGKDPQATGFRIGIDCLLLDKVLYPGSLEGESLTVLGAEGGDYLAQEGSHPQMSGGTQLWYRDHSGTGHLDLEVTVPAAGKYEVTGWFSKSTDYGIFQTLVDGRKVGNPVDLYSEVFWVYGGECRLGTIDLSAGRHVLRFQTVGKNPASKGYYLGLDALRFSLIK